MRPREGGLRRPKISGSALLQPACSVCVSLIAFFITISFHFSALGCCDGGNAWVCGWLILDNPACTLQNKRFYGGPGGPRPPFKSLPPVCPHKWSSSRRYFNRSICYCVTRLAGVSLSVVNCAPPPICRHGPILGSPVLAFLEPPPESARVIAIQKIDWKNERI